MQFDALRPGDSVTLTFPVRETEGHYTVNAHTAKEQTCACVFRAGTLVDITPRDEALTSYPLYRRSHLRKDTVPSRHARLFVPARLIRDW